MTSGSRTRAAGGALALAIAALAGCNGGAQVARMATSPNRPQSALASAGRAALLPATVALDSPSEMASIEPSASTVGTTEPAPAAEPSPARVGIAPPTPLLDAALVRSRAIADVVVDDMASKPDPSAAVPAPARVEPPEPPRVASGDPVPPEPLRPDDIWRDEIRRLIELARAKSDQAGREPGPWSLRARVLDWLAGPEIDPDLGHRAPDGVRTVLRVLDDPANPPRTRGDDLRSAVQVLEDKAPLELVELRLCSRVESFDDYKPVDPAILKADQSVVIYTEIDGIRFDATTSGYRSKLAGRVEILPADGGPAILARPLAPAEYLSRRRRRDYFIAAKFTMPKPMMPGEYKLRVTWKDVLADRSASREVAFAIARD